MDVTSITLKGDFRAPFADLLVGSLFSALANKSKLPESVLSLVGMSGRRYRHMINDFLGKLDGARYLEIGSWAGSTAASAMYGNSLNIMCIDNWLSFPGFLGIDDPRQAFDQSVNLAKSPSIDLKVIQNDFRQIDYASLVTDTAEKFNVYLFDGPHEYKDQYDGVIIAQPSIESLYVQIVDDWNWPDVRRGTFDALAEIGAEVLFSIEIKTTQDDTHPTGAVMENSDWHNGYIFAVVNRGD